jgi:GAF domain-containing protein/HAMP domain-containing protein
MDITIQKSNSFLERLLARTGGWYVIIVTALAQSIASVAMLFGITFEQINADYSLETKLLLQRVEVWVIPATIATLLGVVILISRNMFVSLNTWKNKPELFNREDSTSSWRTAHNIIWKYAIAATIIYFSFIVIPKTILLDLTGLATRDQIIYGFIAGLITNLSFVPLSTILLDQFLVPVRNQLIPNDFPRQLSGLSNLRILYKILAVVSISLFITALLIAPIGYHQTMRVIYEEVEALQVITDLQIQSILVSGFAIIFAVSLAYLFSRSISDPLQTLLISFQKVESGDLSTRVAPTSSDEISQLAIYFNRMVARLQTLQKDLEKKVEERTSQLKAINEVSRVTTSILDPEELLKRVVELITKEFGYYYSAVYLLDHTGHWCDLKAATGEAGRVLTESRHRVEATDTNIIGKSIRTRQAQVMVEVRDKATRNNNPLLPYTRSEISLPLLVGDQISGVLDVHSTHAEAFSEQDIETLQNMANQVAISLDNARLFEETRFRLNELNNIQKLYLRDAWTDSNLSHGGISLAIGKNAHEDEEKLVEFPITLRDQIIGQLKVGGEETLSIEDKNWIQAIVAQAALALENARLLEESQSAAVREKFVTEIANKIWASTSIDGVLQTTVRELGQILDATEATIEIDVEESRGI